MCGSPWPRTLWEGNSPSAVNHICDACFVLNLLLRAYGIFSHSPRSYWQSTRALEKCLPSKLWRKATSWLVMRLTGRRSREGKALYQILNLPCSLYPCTHEKVCTQRKKHDQRKANTFLCHLTQHQALVNTVWQILVDTLMLQCILLVMYPKLKLMGLNSIGFCSSKSLCCKCDGCIFFLPPPPSMPCSVLCARSASLRRWTACGTRSWSTCSPASRPVSTCALSWSTLLEATLWCTSTPTSSLSPALCKSHLTPC